MTDERLVFEGAFAESTSSEDGKVLKNVLLCGNKSLNGYLIPESAFGSPERAAGLYSGRQVYLDHAYDAGPRTVRDFAGVIKDARLEGGKPRGDIHIAPTQAGEELKKLHAFSKEQGGVGLGMSHTAAYRFSDKDRKQVESVEQVFSVDVVSRPATTTNFTESNQQQMAEENKLADQLAKVSGERDAAKASLEGVQKELDALKTESAKTKTALEAAMKELDSLKTAEAVAKRKADIATALKVEGLDPADKEVCSERFLADLASQPDAALRLESIKDRAALVKKAKAAPAPTSQEREAETTNKFDAFKALESVTFIN